MCELHTVKISACKKKLKPSPSGATLTLTDLHHLTQNTQQIVLQVQAMCTIKVQISSFISLPHPPQTQKCLFTTSSLLLKNDFQEIGNICVSNETVVVPIKLQKYSTLIYIYTHFVFTNRYTID